MIVMERALRRQQEHEMEGDMWYVGALVGLSD
jgi:hypothetical protein